MRRISVLATAILPISIIISSGQVLGQSCTVTTGTTSLGAWISIPNAPSYDFGAGAVPLRSVEDLCAALTAAGAVGVTITQHFHSNSETYTWDCAGGAGACTSTSAIPENSCCGSACFCLEPGEGYEIHATTGATATIGGTNVSTTVTIP